MNRMTNEEAKKMLEAKLKCFIAETSGTNHDCNMRLCDGCALNYEQGNMGEQKEALEIAINALETYSCIKEKCAYCPHCEHCDVDDETLAIKNMRYKPVILQEHDAEPRRLNAILDTKTKEVYVRAALTGFTIEEVER